MFLKKWLRLFRRKPSRFDDLVLKLETFSPTTQANTFSSDMSIRTVHPLYASVVDYTSHLKIILEHLEDDTIVSKQYAGLEPIRVYKRDFFTASGYNVDPVQKSREFIEQSLLLTKWYNEKMNVVEPSFNTSKNLLYLQKVIANIETLTEELLM